MGEEEKEEEEEEEELNRTMTSDAYIESMQKGRLKNEVTGDPYVDAMRSSGRSIASDGNSPLGKMNSPRKELVDPWGFDEKKLKIGNTVDDDENDDDIVNNESPTTFSSRSNSNTLRALETPMFSPVAEQPKYKEKEEPKFSPRLTRAQSRAQRSAKYFK